MRLGVRLKLLLDGLLSYWHPIFHSVVNLGCCEEALKRQSQSCADKFVYDYCKFGIGPLAALAQAANLRRACLVVNQNRYAPTLTELALNGVDVLARVR